MQDKDKSLSCRGHVSTNDMSESYFAAARMTGGKKQKLGESEGKSHPFTTRPSVATLCGQLSRRCVSQREELVAEHSAVKQPRREKYKLSPEASTVSLAKTSTVASQQELRSCGYRHSSQ